MSKDKPEVGDVWETNESVLYKIIATNKIFSRCLIKDYDDYRVRLVLNSFFRQDCKLLGNNSITLEQLFEVQE